MKREQKLVRACFAKLRRSPLKPFPIPRQKLDAPDRKGVYVIYDARGRVLHVGRTPKAKGGLAQRLSNHLSAASSFTKQYLKGKGTKLRHGCVFRCLVVEDSRLRALVEAYAIGYLCPAHLGLGEPILRA